MLELQHNDPETWVFLDGSNLIQITASNTNIKNEDKMWLQKVVTLAMNMSSRSTLY